MKVHCGMLMGMLGMHLHSHITHHRGIVGLWQLNGPLGLYVSL